jgi:long-chain acyl-CoA synthetase
MAIQTLCQLFYASVDGFKKPEQLRYKKDGAWRAVSSDELRTAVEELAAGLDALGIAKGDHVAILSENRPEWA